MAAYNAYDDSFVIDIGDDDATAGLSSEQRQLVVSREPSENSANSDATNRMSFVRLPPFWESQPLLWCSTVEARFRACNIDNDDTVFSTVVSQFEEKVAIRMQAILRTPPAIRKWPALKRAICEEFGDSEDQRIKKFFNAALGDKKPSRLLGEMKVALPELDQESLDQETSGGYSISFDCRQRSVGFFGQISR